VQVDLNMPGRLGAFYIDEHSNKVTPVMLHRAMFGLLERFISILIEHHGGHLRFGSPLCRRWSLAEEAVPPDAPLDGTSGAAVAVATPRDQHNARDAGKPADVDLDRDDRYAQC
jgi:hypothetical protein